MYKNSENFNSLKRTGRPSITSQRDVRFLVSKVRKSPEKTSVELARDLEIIRSKPISPSNVRKYC